MYNQTPTEQEMLKALEAFDTPTITNVVATYPADCENCLGLYHPWEGHWYTDSSMKCIYPDLGPRAGFAVTCVMGLPDPDYSRLSMADLLRALDASPKQTVVVIKQDFPRHIKKICGLSGGNMTTAFKRLGAVGCVSDGPSRDIDEIRPMEFQYLLTGVCAGHGPFQVRALNVPVDVCGMRVAPGDIIHMDANGAVKFPREYLPQVLALAEKLSAFESDKQAAIRAGRDVDEVIKAFTG